MFWSVANALYSRIQTICLMQFILYLKEENKQRYQIL